MKLELQLKKENAKEAAKRFFIDQTCDRVREYAEIFLRGDTSEPPKPITVRLKENVEKDQMNAEAITQIILHILDHTAYTIDKLMNEPQDNFFEYIDRMHDEIDQELDALFTQNKPIRIINSDPIPSEYKAIYRTFEGMDEHYEKLLNARVIEEPLQRKHLDAIAAMHNRRVIRSKRAYRLAKRLDDDRDSEETKQVFIEDFDVDRDVIEQGLLNAETMDRHNNYIATGSVVLHPNGTLLGFTILFVFRENCDDKRMLQSQLERGYSGGGLQYHGKRKGKKRKADMLKAVKEGKPFVILVEVGGEVPRAARMSKWRSYSDLREKKILKNNDFVGVAYWSRGVVMEWVDPNGAVEDVFEGIEDPPGKNEGGEEITRKFAMGRAGSFGSDSDIKNRKKTKEFPAEDGSRLRVTTEWANVSGTGEKIMAAAEKYRPPVIDPEGKEATSE